MSGKVVCEEPEINMLGASSSFRKTVIYKYGGESFRGASYVSMNTGKQEYDFGGKPSDSIDEALMNAYPQLRAVHDHVSQGS